MNRDFLEQNGIDVAQGLELLGDMDMYNETILDFLEEQKTRIPALKEYEEKEDCENYAILAHAMKSDSKYLGLTKLIEIAYTHELKGKEKDIAYIHDNFVAFMEEANRVGNVLQEYINA